MAANLKIGNKILLYNAGVEAVGEYQEGVRVRADAPKIILEISPFIPPFIPIEFISEDVGGIVVNCNWSKSRSAPGGSFTVTLAADDERIKQSMGATMKITAQDFSLRDFFKPQTMAKLWFNGYHVMTGYLDSFNKSTSTTSREYVAVFSELGNIYSQSIIDQQTVTELSALFVGNSMSKLMDLSSRVAGLPIHLALYQYVQAFLASSLLYGNVGFPSPYFKASDGIPMAFRMIAQPAPLGGISTNSIISQQVADTTLMNLAGGTTFWDFIKSLAPEPFMELFTESGGRTICTGRVISNPASLALSSPFGFPAPIPGVNVTPMLPGFNYLICRSVPYDNPYLGFTMWPQVYPICLGVMDLLLAGDFIIITDADIIKKDLGVSGQQQHTAFYADISASSNGSVMKGQPAISGGPINPLYPGGARTFGLRAMRAGMPASSMHTGGLYFQVLDRVKKRTIDIPTHSSLLKVWFRNQSKFNEGSITTRAIPYARPGMLMLYLPALTGHPADDVRDMGMYYIDNMSTSYSNTEVPTSTFSVIRGTPLPLSLNSILSLFFEWETFPPNLGLFDGELY